MKKRTNARQRLNTVHLEPGLVLKIMRRLFSRKNDYGPEPDSELIQDLAQFGISDRGRFQALMKRHRRILIASDRARLSVKEQQLYIEVFGASVVRDAVRRRYWYAYPALIRSAMEFEFGPAAEKRE